MSDREYLPGLVAVTLIRETLRMASEHDRLAVAGAAHRYAKFREGHEAALRRILLTDRLTKRLDEEGLENAGVRAVAAGEFVSRTFDDDMPDTTETACLGGTAGNLIGMAVQASYAEMDGHLRLRFKQALRVCASCAAPPLDEEVGFFLALCDSQDSWELEQQLTQ